MVIRVIDVGFVLWNSDPGCSALCNDSTRLKLFCNCVAVDCCAYLNNW